MVAGTKRADERRRAHAMAKIQNGLRMAREGYAELAALARARKAEKRAQVAQGESSAAAQTQASIDNATRAAGLL